jgi:hypothetical protein
MAKISKPSLSNLKDTRNKVKLVHDNENQALTANIEELELELKTSWSGGEPKASSSKRQYLLGA